MTQLLDEPRSVSHRPEKKTERQIEREVAREVSVPVVGPGRIEMPTHPAMPRLHSAPSLHTGRLRFAPAPTDDGTDNSTDDSERPIVPARLTRRADWAERAFELGWIGLMVACAAECVCRLLWAVQP